MNKTGTIAAALLATAALAFAARKPKQTKPAADFFPLRVGDSWTYRNSEEGGYTLRVLREEPQTGGPSRFVVEVSSGVKILSTFSKAEGWVWLHFEQYVEHEALVRKYDPPRQYLPNPLVPGQKWEWSGLDPTQTKHNESNRVVGIEEVTVPAGKFRAVKVISNISGTTSMTKTYWYADGVGLVKTTTEGGQIKYGSELTDYSFKKKPPK